MNIEHNNSLIPFLKWAGGKRWLVSSKPEFFPKNFNYYLEPFLGSGAVFFHLNPEKSILADINSDLIETYRAISLGWKKVLKHLKIHDKKHSKKYYYQIRNFQPRSPYTKAARLIYLNRTCWNGLYRINRNGMFNVPIGTKKRAILNTDNFELTSKLLKSAELTVSDFEPIIDKAQLDDFVFIDPPYTANHRNNGFIKYNEKLFSWEDQIRLKYAILRAKNRGAKILLTNSSHKSIQDLYSDFGQMFVLKRSSIIAADTKKRKDCHELIVKI